MLITTDLVLSWTPCSGYTRERLDELLGDGLTPIQVCDLADVNIIDRLWVLLREDVIPPKELRLLACYFAESVLHVYESKHPNDDRPRNTIETARQYANGGATDEELKKARSAAYYAAEAAAWDNVRDAEDAARSAEWAAAGDDAWDAAYYAAYAAWSGARYAARNKQLAMVRKVLVELYEKGGE